jgi:magnesium-transporting ATPase (P-type)
MAGRAKRAALQELLVVKARVRRDGEEETLSADELVPGDIVELESGKRVPADLRLLEARNLTVDESLLTGESMAVEKSTSAVDEETGVSDRTGMVFAGSAVTSGRGLGVVAATGLQTEVGRISETVTESTGGKPPLLIRMERFAHRISYVVVGASLLLALVAFWQGRALSDVFFLAVALAVSAIPEGLPVALTVALSVATKRMARRKVIVRKLAAVESLGSCQVIASDKTGTLTVNQQTAALIQESGGNRFLPSQVKAIREKDPWREKTASLRERRRRLCSKTWPGRPFSATKALFSKKEKNGVTKEMPWMWPSWPWGSSSDWIRRRCERNIIEAEFESAMPPITDVAVKGAAGSYALPESPHVRGGR